MRHAAWFLAAERPAVLFFPPLPDFFWFWRRSRHLLQYHVPVGGTVRPTHAMWNWTQIASSDACWEGRRTRVIGTHPFSLAVVIIAPYHLPVAHTIAEAVRPVVLRVSVGLASSARGTVVSLLRDLREVTRDGHPRTLELTMRPFRHDAVADSARSMGLREDACRVGYKGCGERRVAGGGRLGTVCIAASRRLLCAFGGR